MPKKRRGERPGGLIQVSCVVGHDEQGKYIRKYFYGHTRAEAEAKRDAYKAEASPEEHLNEKLTVKEWVEEYERSYMSGINPIHKKAACIPFDKIAGKLQGKTVREVREKDLQAILNDMAGMSFSTLNRYRQAMRRLFSKARINKIIRDDPSEGLTLPKAQKGTHRALSLEERKRVLAMWKYHHAGVWCLLMMLCGLRKGEAMALDWENVDMQGRVVKVRQTAATTSNRAIIEQRAKSSAGIRDIPMCGELYAALSTITPKTGLVCRSFHGEPLTPSAFRSGLASYQKLCGVTFRAHDLRHTYATALYEAGVPVKAAQYYLGHASVAMTMDLYTHLTREQESESAGKISAYLDGMW